MAKTDSKFVKEILDRLESSSNDAKAKEIVRALDRRIRNDLEPTDFKRATDPMRT
jgi:hypothetical protein